MCGITGFSNFKTNYFSSDASMLNSTKTLKNMRNQIKHRGENQSGEYLSDNVGMAHARLSIRDLDNGTQPMTRVNFGCEYTICYNGEIYNTDEIKSDLDFDFQTTCDTEVILYAYIKHGVDIFKKLNGIFAFAIHDKTKGQLIVARDHLGVKPLFYAHLGDDFIFGSEIKSVLENPLVQPMVDTNSFREIIGIGPARTHGNGVFVSINELKPGHYGVFSQNGLNLVQYWDLTASDHTDSYSQTVENTRNLVKQAIELQMVSDVSICSFLSGGIDSSIITAVASAKMQADGKRLNTYSFDFCGNDKHFKSNAFQPERDRPYVDIALKKYNTNHTYLNCNEPDLAELLTPSMLARDLPGMADVDASLLYFCNVVKEQNVVALTGECADEIFGGYPWFYREDLLYGNGFPWSRNLAIRTSLLHDDFARKLDIENYVQDQYDATISRVPTLITDSKSEAKLREITYLNIKWFMQTLLDRMDRMSMQSGLEARVPFADYRIIEYIYNVPFNFKRQNGVEKSLLRDAFADMLPPELLNRKKSPYPKTYDPTYEMLLKSRLMAIIQDKNAPIHEFYDKKKIIEFIEQPSEYAKPWFGQLMSGPQMIAYIIQVNDWLSEYNPKISLS